MGEMNKIRAEESLTHIKELMLGGGLMKKAEQSKEIRKLEKLAGGKTKVTKSNPRTPKELHETLSVMGIGKR